MTLLTTILIIAFIIRVCFTFYNNKYPILSNTADENTHLAQERLLAQGKNLKIYLKKHTYNRTFNGYPDLFHRIANFFFQNDYSLLKRRYLSGFFSIIFPVFFFFIGIKYYNFDTVTFVTIAILLGLNFFGLFLRQYKTYNPRSFADFMLMNGYLFVILYFQTDESLFYILAVFSFSLMWFASEFGIQSIILTSILWSILSRTTLPLEISTLSLIAALLFSKKKVLDNLNHKLFHWLWYTRNSSWLYNKHKIKITNLKSFYNKITSNIIVGKLLQFVPFLPVFIFYAVYDFNQNQFVNSFILSAFIIAILTITKTFSFLGPSFRYLLYAAPFMWMILYENNKDLALILISLEVIVSMFLASIHMIKLKSVSTELKKNKFDEIDKVLRIIDKKKNTILLSPVKLDQVFFTKTNKIKAKYVSIWDNDFNLNALLFFEKHMKNYPYINDSYKDLIRMKKEVSANIFVIDKLSSSGFYSKNFFKMLSKHSVLYQSERFLIVKL